MKENALISVTTNLVYEDDGIDSIEMITQGQYCVNDGEFIIKYSESDPEQIGNINTTMTISPDGLVTIVREGDIHSHMVFEQGHKHLMHYDTQYGSITVGISAKKVATLLGENGGDVEIDYAIEIDNALASENTLRLNVRKSSIPS